MLYKIELCKCLALNLTVVKSFQRLCHVQFSLMLTLICGIDLLFEKITPKTGGGI